ncbi:uncharacterized protein PFL1_03448 [Pseudozyma flocculosa PF-1]|uniref:Uncharacterized protein n=2 Tax=Pseudozyma flocculosa TaxID=84751 RepID=A0A5C3FAV4_9BASI|nr:uncharacterized protein PFL1_03448 [Pseudozyma flocculosa PF-1]EPQ29161.1 hypothetical protein PFL1_03448 [Pseudozyma flocculosa PF-1]SPO41542.1 uncharacterized protein PSFLO_07024 [Pseudozyma flocculosa]
MSRSSPLLALLLVSASLFLAPLAAADDVAASRNLHILPGSPIFASTTAFNPALTNQGGTTNSAGTFDVSPLATSTSYQFQPASQTTSFAVQSPNFATPNAGNAGSGGGSASAPGAAVTQTVVQTSQQTSFFTPSPTDAANGPQNGGVAAATASSDAQQPVQSINLAQDNAASGHLAQAQAQWKTSLCAAIAVVGASMLGVVVVA